MMPDQEPPGLPDFGKLYRVAWLQQLFPYYNIQSLDVVQMSTCLPEDLNEYGNALNAIPKVAGLEPFVRLWRSLITLLVGIGW